MPTLKSQPRTWSRVRAERTGERHRGVPQGNLWARLFCVVALCALPFAGQTSASSEYQIYAGSTHSHTTYTWSHGSQLGKSNCSGILFYGRDPGSSAFTWSGSAKGKEGCPGILVINGSQYPAPGTVLKPDWEKNQGPPSTHFQLAKDNGYDFYAVTDHSQEAAFQPPSPSNEAWLSVKQQAAAATDRNFVALAGFEYSENDGPGGKGHINVFNTAGIANALLPGADLPHFYRWLPTAQPNGDGPVVASFNHPGPGSYGNWADRDPQVTEIITMLEVINSNNKIHYQAFLNALDHGWKVSPVCGNDNHGFPAIARNTSRTFVLAKGKTKAAILDAMKNRRTYASLDKNIQCRYTVNGMIMGSTLKPAGKYAFDISIADPDITNPQNKITKIDIVKDYGTVVQEYTPTPDHSIHWTPLISDTSGTFFFVRVWTADGGDAPGADPSKPVAWLAPVWIGK